MSAGQARSKLAHEARTAKRKNQPAESAEPVQAVRRESAEAKIAEYISRAVALAPPLDDEQRNRLGTLLHPVVNARVSPRRGAM